MHSTERSSVLVTITYVRSGVSEDLLRYAIVVVSIINVQAVVVPVIALLVACSTLASPISGVEPDPAFWSLQMRRLKEVLSATSAILVSGIVQYGSLAALAGGTGCRHQDARSAPGAALAIMLFWGVTFTLMLVFTYLPAALLLARRAQALLRESPSRNHPLRILNNDSRTMVYFSRCKIICPSSASCLRRCLPVP